MSQYYTPRRKRNLYNPKSPEAFRLSRSKIDLYLECPRCFYLDRRLGVDRPPGFPFALNSAVDTLLKKEFDLLRKNGEGHPLMKKYGIDAVPAPHDKLQEWRNNFKGIQYLHEPTNLIITGAIDDLWQNPNGEYIIAEFKSTSKNEEIVVLDKEWHGGFKRQMEVYQWLLRRNGFKVSDTGYFIYCNGKTDVDVFDGKLEFDLTIIPHKGDDSWIEDTIKNIHKCLVSEQIPPASGNCDYCSYRSAAGEVS